MEALYIVLLLLGLVCFLVAAFANVPRVNLVALGLAFWIFVPFFQLVLA